MQKRWFVGFVLCLGACLFLGSTTSHAEKKQEKLAKAHQVKKLRAYRLKRLRQPLRLRRIVRKRRAVAQKQRPRGPRIVLQKGELLRFRAKIGEVEGGYAFMAIKKVSKRTSGVRVQAYLKARTNSFFDKVHRVNNRFSSDFDLHQKKSFRYRMNVDQAGTIQIRKIHFTPLRRRGTLKLHVKSKYKKPKKGYRHWRRSIRVPDTTRDLVSAIYHARTLPYRPGLTFSFHVFVTGKLWRVTGRLVRTTSMYSILGKRKVFEIEATGVCLSRPGPARKLKAWITADAQRVPLRIQGRVPYLGYITAKLAGYRRNSKSRYLDGRQSGRLRYLLKQF